jgi:hypothetical protein
MAPSFEKGRETMAKRCVMGVLVTNRVQNVPEFQKVLTECGCQIKTRLGLHDTGTDFCSPNGLILLELFGSDAAYDEVEAKLKAVKGLQVQKMLFDE